MAAQPPAQARAYRDFLTPLLHRRFTEASVLVLAVCWLEATLLSPKSILTAWIPLGITGLRTLLLFCPCLAVFIVRLSDLHFGARTARSDWALIQSQLLTTKAVLIWAWYIYSAFFFGEVYIWSKGQESNLGWVDYGRAYERPRLNENPMLLRCAYQVLALVAAFTHVYWEVGCVPVRSASSAATPLKGVWARLPAPVQEISKHGQHMIRTVLNLALAGVVCTILTYHLLLRRAALQFAQLFGAMMYKELATSSSFDGLIALPGLLWQILTSLVMLSSLWTFSNIAFTVLVAQPPIKRSQPLTNQTKDNAGNVVSRSSDPNGSLITGLKSKKNGPHMFAMWELCLICTEFADRRKTMFLEVDRVGGSTWSQISQQCLVEISGIATRIHAYHASLTPKAPVQPTSQQAIAGLPKIANEQVRPDNVLNKAKPDLAHSISDLAKSAGSHPRAESPLSPIAKKAWQVLSPEQQVTLSGQTLSKEVKSQLVQVLRTPAGAPFRETFDKVARTTVLGSPYSSELNIIFAARSLASLLKASLAEDTCGVVAKDVPTIIRTLTASIMQTQRFLSSAPPSWTDVGFSEQQRRVEDVAEVIVELQNALEVMLLAFSEYSSAIGLSRAELREAKEAVGMLEKH